MSCSTSRSPLLTDLMLSVSLDQKFAVVLGMFRPHPRYDLAVYVHVEVKRPGIRREGEVHYRMTADGLRVKLVLAQERVVGEALRER